MRGDIRFVVAEHCVADLFGRTLRERAEAPVQIASPSFRDELTASARPCIICNGRRRGIRRPMPPKATNFGPHGGRNGHPLDVMVVSIKQGRLKNYVCLH